VAELLAERVWQLPGVSDVEVCGSVRRRRDTVKDLDLVCATTEPREVCAAFARFPEVVEVIGEGGTKVSVILAMALGQGPTRRFAVDLRAVTPEQFPVTILHFTGSKAHNIRLRQRAQERGYTLNEYALSSATGPLPCASETDIYAHLGLMWIPPELREDRGEIEAAEAGQLPELIEPTTLRGAFHNHTTESDGSGSLWEMVQAAQALGWEYLGIADHSQSLTVANGLTPARVRRQWDEIDHLNSQLGSFRIFKGNEVDILKDGSLDFSDELLRGFDYVVASVHSHFDLSEEEQTARICKALQHPAVTMLGHPSGRLLLRRDAYKLDMESVLRAAAKHGKMIEINAQPDRLDLDWTHLRRAKELGIRLVINPDAHAPQELAFVEHGFHVARRGWLTAADVFNTQPLSAVIAELEARRQQALSSEHSAPGSPG
jgi:DNA polymerase (family 10)